MLRLILGGAGSGKSAAVQKRIRELAESGYEKLMLIVPEQFSFESERQLYQLLGPVVSKRVQVYSFTRLADMIFRTYGGLAGRYANDAQKTVLIRLAIDEVMDTLDVYAKAADNPGFGGTMLQVIAEMKNAAVSPQQLEEAATSVASDGLRRKTEELARIYAAYDALLGRSYLDPLDDLTRAAKRAEGRGFFKDFIVFFDEFKSFTANEHGLIRQIFSDARDVYISLCLGSDGDAALFAPIRDTQRRLLRLAREAGTPVGEPMRCEEGKRFQTPVLSHLAQNLLRPRQENYSGLPAAETAVRFITARDEYDEADYALSMMLELTQSEGYRFSDITLMVRDMEVYRSVLESGFEKYGIPYFLDERRPISHLPLIRFVCLLLSAAVRLDTDPILAMCKCGVTPYPEELIGALENYCYTWNVKGQAWRAPFTMNPNGFSDSFTDEDRVQVAQLDDFRSVMIHTLDSLAESAAHELAGEISGGVYEALELLGVRPEMESRLEALYEAGDSSAAEEARIWDILMEVLDVLAQAAGDHSLSLKKYTELFELIVAQYDMGVPPQTLDAVPVGSAGRMRTDNPRAVFILGANAGVLPYVPPVDGVFTDRERKELIDLGLPLAPPAEERLAEERFIAYKALTAPSEKLYVTSRRADIAGKTMNRSELYAEAERMFGASVMLDTDSLDPAFYCRTERTAFYELARNYRDDASFTATLRDYFAKDPAYSDRLNRLDDALQNRAWQLRDQSAAQRLFGRNMTISPSRIESFYQCRFKYFCGSGLRAKGRQKAELNPLETGSLIHSVLYSLTSAEEPDFMHLSDRALRTRIRALLDAYIETVMGGETDKSPRFRYLYRRMQKTLYEIAAQLRREFAESEFVPGDFELPIDQDAAVKPLRIELAGGGSVSIAGRVDRVDLLMKNGRKYVRVVDYKSGVKEFNLADIYYGLNLQMMVYLFCIWKNGTGKYADVLPAGVLYMPARRPEPKLGRDADEEAAEKERLRQYRMDGLLIEDDEVLRAMDKSGEGIFIPVKRGKDGTPAKTAPLVSLEQMGELYAYTEKLASDMADELHRGQIAAEPGVGLGYDPCTYCDFRSVCGHGPQDPTRRLKNLDRAHLFEQIRADRENQRTASEPEQISLFDHLGGGASHA